MALTLTRSGQQNNAGDARALYLKMFANEVIKQTNEDTLGIRLTRTRTVGPGKSHQFPVFGRLGRERNAYIDPTADPSLPTTVGNEARVTQIPVNEVTINIDQLYARALYVYDLDEMLEHFESRSEYVRALAYSLSAHLDMNILQTLILGARSAAFVDNAFGGTQLDNVAYNNDSDTLVGGLFDSLQNLAEKRVDIRQGDIHSVFRPEQYFLLAQNTKVLNRDWGGSGAFATATLGPVANTQVHMTNHLPGGTLSATEQTLLGTDDWILDSVTGEENTYSGNFSDTVGLVFKSDAIANLIRRGIRMETDRLVLKQTDLIVASFVAGHGILKPDHIVELTSSDESAATTTTTTTGA